MNLFLEGCLNFSLNMLQFSLSSASFITGVTHCTMI